MQKIAAYWDCPPVHYVRYGLYGRNLSDEELLDYIPAYYFYNFYLAPRHKGVDKRVFDNKLQLFRLFRANQISTPTVLAVVKRHKLYEPDNMRPCPKLLDMLAEKGKRLFFKPVDGQGGTGIKVYKKERDGYIENFITRLDIDTTYVVQEAIEQRNDISMINASSVNTLRVITQNEEGKSRVCACIMRIGRKGKEVDNSHQGGISVEIDVDSGALNPVATAEHGGGAFTSHPDSGFVFEGKTVDGWAEIKKTVQGYADRFPDLKEIGWDIALTAQGVQAIELNLNFGLDHLQSTCGGMRRRLGVYPGNRKNLNNLPNK